MLVTRPNDTTAIARILNLATPSNASMEKSRRAKVRTEIYTMNVKYYPKGPLESEPFTLVSAPFNQ